jgi:ACS family glucarate transporter-like MFS transporter
MFAAIFAAYSAALLALTLGITLSGFAGPATWAATMDVGGKSSTSVMAILNMSGNFGAYLCPKAIGWILGRFHERWDLVMMMLAIVYFTGGLCWLAVDPDVAKSSRSRVT